MRGVFECEGQDIASVQDIPEAQRYYELGMSYFKSDMYEKGLDIMNQVAFLYPESDVADDALYQLALIREKVGDGKLVLGKQTSREAESEILTRLSGTGRRWGTLADLTTLITAFQVGRALMKSAEQRAITQYFFALDDLTTLRTRYPQSDRFAEVNAMVERVSQKIESLLPDPPPPPKPKPQEKPQKKVPKIVGLGIVGLFALIVMMAS